MTEKEKLIQMLLEDEEIKRYKRIEEYINSNKELKEKFNELKAVQKQLVNAKHIGKTEAVQALETKYNDIYETIESYPLMSDYMALQSDINEMIQHVVAIIEDGLDEDFKK